MEAFFSLMKVLLSWPRYGRHNLPIAVLTVTELGALVAGTILVATSGGLWWLALIIAVIAYVFTGLMISVMEFMDIFDPVS